MRSEMSSQTWQVTGTDKRRYKVKFPTSTIEFISSAMSFFKH